MICEISAHQRTSFLIREWITILGRRGYNCRYYLDLNMSMTKMNLGKSSAKHLRQCEVCSTNS